MAAIRPYADQRSIPIARSSQIRPSSRTIAVAALIGANVIWGGSVVASKAALGNLPPLTLAALRVSIALAVLSAFLARTGTRPARGPIPALMGLTGIAIFCAGQNLGLRYADATTAALIGGAIPVLTALFAIPILGERCSGRLHCGLGIALVGTAVVVRGSGASLSGETIGNLLPLASAAGFAAYAVLGRRAFSGNIGAMAVVAGSTAYGLLFLLPGAALEIAAGGVGPLTGRDTLLLLYLGVGCSAVAFVLYGFGLSHLAAGQAAAFGNLKPLVGVILAVALLGETVGIGQVGGGALVLLGVGLAGPAPGKNGTGAQITKVQRLPESVTIS